MELERRLVIKFLHVKGIRLGNIVTELSDMSGRYVHAKPSIKYWPHQLRLGRKDLTIHHLSGRPTLDDTDAEISSMFRISPFSAPRSASAGIQTLSEKVSALKPEIGQKLNDPVVEQLSTDFSELRKEVLTLKMQIATTSPHYDQNRTP
jgi:hypothetical protein